VEPGQDLVGGPPQDVGIVDARAEQAKAALKAMGTTIKNSPATVAVLTAV
jgi:hypothetical protein